MNLKMADTVKVICENTGKSLYVEQGTSLTEIVKMLSIRTPFPFLAAYVNNEIKELAVRIFSPVSVRFVDVTHYEGLRVYERTLFFILHKAVTDVFPGSRLQIKYSVAKGFYCEIVGMELTPEDVSSIRERMRDLVDQDITIVWEKVLNEEAIEISRQLNAYDKIKLLSTRPHLYVKVYRLADLPGYFYGALAPSTGYIDNFDLIPYFKGMHLAVPSRRNPGELEEVLPQNKMFEIFQEFKDWTDIIGVSTLGALNGRLLDGEMSDLIKIAEALHEKKLASIADTIHDCRRQGKAKLVLVSGPSSSGKTTFAKRLGIHLQVLGIHPVLISLDNYFVNREDTPIDENGEHDFEALEAVNVELFNQQLIRMMNGEEVLMPRYDFVTGKSIPDSLSIKLRENSVIIVEGIHGLNPGLIPHIPAELTFKIYMSALTSISIDDLTRVPTTDNRLIRRIVRDNAYRNHTAVATIRRWQSVRRGEDKYVFPYQENADVMFNSALFFELCILKSYAEPLLHEVPDTVPEYAEARRLLRFLDLFVPISDKEIPPTSILREFIGGGSFRYD